MKRNSWGGGDAYEKEQLGGGEAYEYKEQQGGIFCCKSKEILVQNMINIFVLNFLWLKKLTFF